MQVGRIKRKYGNEKKITLQPPRTNILDSIASDELKEMNNMLKHPSIRSLAPQLQDLIKELSSIKSTLRKKSIKLGSQKHNLLNLIGARKGILTQARKSREKSLQHVRKYFRIMKQQMSKVQKQLEDDIENDFKTIEIKVNKDLEEAYIHDSELGTGLTLVKSLLQLGSSDPIDLVRRGSETIPHLAHLFSENQQFARHLTKDNRIVQSELEAFQESRTDLKDPDTETEQTRQELKKSSEPPKKSLRVLAREVQFLFRNIILASPPPLPPLPPPLHAQVPATNNVEAKSTKSSAINKMEESEKLSGVQSFRPVSTLISGDRQGKNMRDWLDDALSSRNAPVLSLPKTSMFSSAAQKGNCTLLLTCNATIEGHKLPTKRNFSIATMPPGVIDYLLNHQREDSGNVSTWSRLDRQQLVACKASSILYGEPANILHGSQNHSQGRFFQSSDKDETAWIMVLLHPRYRLVPNGYSLSYYRDGDSHIPMSWKIEGSNNGLSWVLIRHHYNDLSLVPAPHVGLWSLTPPKDADGRTVAFRFFRVILSGQTSSDSSFLVLSGMELYGDILSTTKSDESTSLDRLQERDMAFV